MRDAPPAHSLAPLLPLLRFNGRIFHLFTRDLPADQLDFRPCPQANSIRWIMGHVVVSLESAVRLLGGRSSIDPAWRAAFDRGSSDTALSVRPEKAELLAAFDAGCNAIEAAVPAITPDHLAAPHGIAFLSATPLVTRGDVLGHLLATHLSFHIGQLSAYRRQLGYATLF